MSKFFITTPIYYVNDVPHLGSAYTTLVADVLARAQRQQGQEVLFLTGTDEHGSKIAQKAAEAGQTPQAFSDKIAAEFQTTWDKLAISYDRFARTTDPKHQYLVGQAMQQLYDAQLVYPGQYQGWYCVGCEEYKDGDHTLEGETPSCEVHGKPLEFLTEELYFFALSRFQERLIELIQSDKLQISPTTRKNEVLSFLTTEPLHDIPVTRSKVSWGVPVPFAAGQTVYVWFDALLNYLSFSGPNVDLAAVQGQQTWWPADVQLLGKDILRFHAVIWPALLLALDLPLPKQLLVHGFFTLNGAKMSKTTGNVIAPAELVDRYGLEAARYLIISAIPLGSDADISWERFDQLYTANLANGLGNLLQRTISLINKYAIKPQVRSAEVAAIKQAYQNNDPNEALNQIWQLIDDTNRYLATTAPWAMTNDAERETILVKSYEALLKVADGLVPIMPETAEAMCRQLDSLQAEPLFPRLAETSRSKL